MSQDTNNKQHVGYEDYNMIPNITPKSILQHLPYKKFKKPTFKKPPCVIVACGSFSPPTFLHLRILEEAKDTLSKDFEVIGGILSPVNDQYGQLHKKSLQAANGTHRVEMARAATQTSDWIGVSDFEVSLDKWTRVAVVLKCYGNALQYYYNNEYKSDENKDKNSEPNNENKQDDEERKVALKFLGGSDLLKSMKTPNLWRKDHQEIILKDYGMVVVERVGDVLNDEFWKSYEMFERNRKNIHEFMPHVENTISSTKLRESIKNGWSIKYLTPDPVIEYIAKNKLYK